MGLKPPNPPHPLATAGPSPGVLDAGHNNHNVHIWTKHTLLSIEITVTVAYLSCICISSDPCKDLQAKLLSLLPTH